MSNFFTLLDLCKKGHYKSVINFIKNNTDVSITMVNNECLKEMVKRGHFKLIRTFSKNLSDDVKNMLYRQAVLYNQHKIAKYLFTPHEMTIDDVMILGNLFNNLTSKIFLFVLNNIDYTLENVEKYFSDVSSYKKFLCLVEKYPNYNFSQHYSQIFLNSCQSGDAKLLNFMFAKGSNFDIENAMSIAFRFDNLKIVKILTPYFKDKILYIDETINIINVETVKYLLDTFKWDFHVFYLSIPDIQLYERIKTLYPKLTIIDLPELCKKANVDVVKYFLSQMENPDIGDALVSSICSHNFETAKYLRNIFKGNIFKKVIEKLNEMSNTKVLPIVKFLFKHMYVDEYHIKRLFDLCWYFGDIKTLEYLFNHRPKIEFPDLPSLDREPTYELFAFIHKNSKKYLFFYDKDEDSVAIYGRIYF